ncbi:MAG TPA: 6-phosphogluconolactonase [Myxococcaceae bacterium]|nr:6-phosphogluconolactonase [Myxococcaceae bacterium]
MTQGSPLVRRVADEETLAQTAAGEFVQSATRAVAARGLFTVALSGGSTPRRLYRLLSDVKAPFRGQVPWERVHVFFGDERHVPPDHPDSNYRMAHEVLLAHVPTASVHRMRGEEPDPASAAASYEQELRRFFELGAPGVAPPQFDLVLLGLGPDGHTASLFPGSEALEERRRWAVAVFVERIGAQRISLTFPVLNRAREVLFLVSGSEKAEALARVLAPGPGVELPPASRVRPEAGALVWMVDRAACARLPSSDA